MDPRNMRVTKNAYFSLLTYAKQLVLVIFCDTIAGIGNSKVWEMLEWQIYVGVEIVIYIDLDVPKNLDFNC